MQENYKNRPVLIIGLTILFFILLSFLPGGVKIGPFVIKPIDIFMDVKPDSLLSLNAQQNRENYSAVSNQNFSHVNPAEETASLIDFDLLYNSIFGERGFTNSTNTPPVFERLSGNVSNMKLFFQALKTANSGTVRVAHYGDSEIEGDLITADFRQNLQEQYSGMGAGFLSITSQDIAFRTSTKHTFASTWDTYSVFSGNNKNTPIGIDGSVSIPKGKSWVQYETTGRFKNLRSFKKVRVFYNNAKSSASITYSFDGGKEQAISLKSGSTISEVVLQSDGEAKSFKFTAADGAANFYGVSLETGNGIYVDNFPLRGNTGVSIRDFSPQILKDFNKLLSYKLIVLSFGLNIASSNMTDYKWYEKEMVKVINLLKASFPQASILIVGVGDKGIKKGSTFITDPNIPKLVEAQRNIAAQSGVAFWDLYKAMGGENSMAKWVNANPPLAFKDYTHVNLLGAEKIADLLTQAILDEFKKSN